MTEIILIIFAAGIIYYVATRVAPRGLMFRVKKDHPLEKPKEQVVESKPLDKTLEERLLEEGQDLLNKGELDASEKKFIEVIKSDPNSALAYHFLGMIYLRQKMYKGAIAALEKATKLDPLNDTAFNNLGLAYYNTENYEKATENIEKSINLNDKIAHRYLNLALAYQKEKNYDKAAIALENSVKIHANVENLTMLAKNYQDMKDKKLAKQAIERLLEIDPSNTWAKRQLAAL
jgi:tetratricopeptide (TPR) repeat protein